MIAGLEPAELPKDAIEVGRVAEAWGIKGWFKVLPYSGDPEALFTSKLWFMLPTEKGLKTFDGVAQLSVKEIKSHSGSLVACAAGVSDRTDAEALRGARIFIARSNFPASAIDEFYWVDLIGLDVVNRENEPMGVVRELMSTGPQTVLVLEYLEDGKTLERMIPFVSVYVDSVDLQARQIVVDWQADY